MTVFCCCRAPPVDDDDDSGDEGVSRQPYQTLIPLPTLPSPAKLADNCHIADCLAPIRTLDTVTSLRSGGGVSSPASSPSPHSHIYLGQLVVDDSDAEGDFDSPVTKRSGGPLDTVRSKFSCTRLHGSSARSSRTSVGTSDEELARRAELRRLMHQRIQEELESEDASPNERCASSASVAKPGTPAPIGGGPRDTLEFSMVDTSLPDDVHQEKQVAIKPSRSLIATSLHSDKAGQQNQPSRASSFQEERTVALPTEYTDMLAHINIPDIPATPVLQPAHPPAENQDASPSSLRLSFAISQGRQPDEVQPGESPSPKKALPLLSRDRSSTFSSWFLGQGLCNSGGSTKKHTRPRVANTQPEEVQQQEVKQEQCHVIDLDLPGVALFEKQNPVDSYSPANDESPGAASPWNDAESVGMQGSSVYPSATTTRRHTPRTSEANGMVGVAQSRSFHGLQLSTLGPVSQGSDHNGILSAGEKAFSQSLGVPTVDSVSRTTLEAPSSIAVSETSSYHRREAELEAVEKRFADVVSRCLQKEPKTSKFKEEFDLPEHPGIVTRSSMMLQKLHLPVPNFSRPRSRSSGLPTTLPYHYESRRAQGDMQGGIGIPS